MEVTVELSQMNKKWTRKGEISQIKAYCSTQETKKYLESQMLLLLLCHFSRVGLCATP